MPSVTLTYGSTSRTFSNALSVKGFRQLDGLVQNLYQRIPLLNGSIRKKLVGFVRQFVIDLGVVTNIDDLAFLGEFLTDTDQSISYTYYEGAIVETSVDVVDSHVEYQSVWIDGVEAGRRMVLTLVEATPRSLYPAPSGEGFGYKFGSRFGTRL